MNQRTKIILGAIIFIIILIGADRLMKMRNTNIDNSTNSSTNESSHVLEVTSSTFDTEVLQSEKKVLIDFYATWCGPCKMLSPIVDEVAGEQNNVKFVKIDVDKNEDLANQYGIYSIPTLVVIENGEESDRSIGLIDKNQVLELIGQ